MNPSHSEEIEEAKLGRDLTNEEKQEIINSQLKGKIERQKEMQELEHCTFKPITNAEMRLADHG